MLKETAEEIPKPHHDTPEGCLVDIDLTSFEGPGISDTYANLKHSLRVFSVLSQFPEFSIEQTYWVCTP